MQVFLAFYGLKETITSKMLNGQGLYPVKH